MDYLFFIAEMSANHLGDFERAVQITKKAKEAGAHAIKLQTYKPEHLTLDCDLPHFICDEEPWKGKRYFDIYKEGQTPFKWQEPIKHLAESIGLHFIGTPFDIEGFEYLEMIGCKNYKISNLELDNLELLEAVGETGKRTFISWDGGGEEHFYDNLDRLGVALDLLNPERTSVLFTTNRYPCSIECSPHLNCYEMREQLGEVHSIGLSDHTKGASCAMLSRIHNGSVFEKHITLDDKPTLDSDFSLPWYKFKRFVDDMYAFDREFKVLRALESEYQGSCFENLIDNLFNAIPVDEDRKPNEKFRKSIYATKEIKEGEDFSTDNVGMFRPGGHGLCASNYRLLLCQKSQRHYSFGQVIEDDIV